MWTYILKRIIWFIPSLFFLAILAFFLSRSTGDDPVERILGIEGVDELNQYNPELKIKEYQRIAKLLGRDRPLFYWSLIPHNYPHSFEDLMSEQEKRIAKSWLKDRYAWKEIKNFRASLDLLEQQFEEFEDSLAFKNQNEWYQILQQLQRETDLDNIEGQLNFLLESNNSSFDESAALTNNIENCLFALDGLKSDKHSVLWPKLEWHGTKNQFHNWFGNLLQGNIGISLADGRPATQRIKDAFSWTLLMVLIAIIISLFLSIPLAFIASIKKNTWIDYLISNTSYFLYAIPLFWLATLLVTFFTTSEYGSWTNIFPAVSSNYLGSSGGFWAQIGQFGKSLILPVFCLVIHSLAYLIKQIKSSMGHQSNAFFVLTGRAKGLSSWSLHRKHIFPNAIIPIITMIVDAFPAALAGSIIIEVIFNIPGIGRLMYNSIFSADWNIVYGILMLLGLMTVISYLLGDILYSIMNPKIRFNKSFAK
jgi:peptide/nickel transport system permease protein